MSRYLVRCKGVKRRHGSFQGITYGFGQYFGITITTYRTYITILLSQSRPLVYFYTYRRLAVSTPFNVKVSEKHMETISIIKY